MTKYKASEKYFIKEIAGEKLLLAKGAKVVDYSAVIVFNDTGIFLWNLLAAPCTKQVLTDALVQEYGIDQSTAAADVNAFLTKSAAEGIVITED